MLREDFLHKSPGDRAVPGSMRFTYLAEVVAKAYEPSSTDLEKLERAYENTGEFLIECPEFEGLLLEVHAQGSRQMGTIVRPMDSAREGFDIDLIARLSPDAERAYGSSAGPVRLLNHLEAVLNRYAKRHGLTLERWERCVTLVYAGGMRADFVPVISDPRRSVERGDHHALIPDRDLNAYLSTNPRGYCVEFERVSKLQANFTRHDIMESTAMEVIKAELAPLPEAAEVLGRLLCRFVQLAKVHRNICFEKTPDSLAPTSVFITSLISRGYEQLAPTAHPGPLELFLDIVEAMPNLFNRVDYGAGQDHWELWNPLALNDNLAASMNSPGRQDAFAQWHGKFRLDLHRLVNAINGESTTEGVIDVVKDCFGERASNAMIAHNAKAREVRRAAGTTRYFMGAEAAVVSKPSRPHQFFGDL